MLFQTKQIEYITIVYVNVLHEVINVDTLCTWPCKVNRNKHKSAVAVKLIVAGKWSQIEHSCLHIIVLKLII